MAEMSESDLKELIETLTQSHIIIGQRIEKTPENSYGFKHVGAIPPDEVALLFLGGTGTEVDKGADRSANGYLSTLEEYLKGHGLEEILQQQGKDTDLKKSIGLYSVIYNFGKNINGEIVCDKNMARAKLYADHKQYLSSNKEKIKKDIAKLDEETKDPHYVDELFEKAFLSRICDEKGKKLPFDEACRRVRNLTVCAHCHGAYTFLKIEEKMQQKMQQLGYSKEERTKIQGQLFCIALAPDAPLGISKSKMISFASVYDKTINGNIYQRNNFKNVIKGIIDYETEKRVDISLTKLAYLSGRRGEVFLVKNLYKEGKENREIEHNFSINPKYSLTKQGNILFFIAISSIAEGIKSSLKKTPITTTKDLFLSIFKNDKRAASTFEILKRNGDILWNNMRIGLSINLAKQYKQKEH